MVSSTDFKNTYAYTGLGNYEISFDYDVVSSLIVEWISEAGVVSAPKTLGVDYNVIRVGATVQCEVLIDFGTGGTIVIRREVPITQTWNGVDGTTPSPTGIMGALDRIVWQIQQVLGRLLGTIRTPYGEVSDMVIPSAAARRGGYFMFEDTPEALPDVVAGISSVPVSTFMEDPLLADDTEEFATLIGAVSTATANKLLKRDANGRAQVAYPSVASDIATKNSIMPVGSIYIQFYNRTTPTTLWGGTWSNVSSSYPGYFFRSEGGAASAWGTTSQAYQNKYHRHIGGQALRDTSSQCLYGTGASLGSVDVLDGLGPYNGYEAYTSYEGASGDQEARPVNQTIRIWERTA